MHPVARRRPPQDVAGQHAVGEVEGAIVGDDISDGQQQRLVVHIEPHDLGVRDVDDGLPHPGETESLLRVPDRPRLVEAVDEGAVAVAVVTLLDIATHPQVAVGDGEQGLGDSQVRGVVEGLGQSPRIGRKAQTIHGVGHLAGAGAIPGTLPGGGHGVTSSARSRTTTSAPASRSVSAPAPRSTPMTRPNPPALSAATPETASSITTALAAALGVPAARAVVIEDAVSGVAAARAGGFGLGIGVDRGAGAETLREAGADVVVRDLAELVTP